MKPHKKKSSDPDALPWAVFRLCKTRCLEAACKECGWSWGPGYDKEEMRCKPAQFGVKR